MAYKAKNEIMPTIKMEKNESFEALYVGATDIEKCDSPLHVFMANDGREFGVWGTGGLNKQLEGESGKKVRVSYYGKRDAMIDGKKIAVHQHIVEVWED